jgi:myo-inositol-1(or 4)-monophosphatase
MLEKLITIINEAGRKLLAYSTRPEKKQVHFKGEVDVVTPADVEIQQFLKTALAREFPDTAFYGEEEQHAAQTEAATLAQAKLFIVDPIDGTTNFIHNNPHYCISLAYREKGQGKIGLVYAPELDLLFFAEKGEPAYVRTRSEARRRMQVSTTRELRQALLITGFACVRDRRKPDNIPLFTELIYQAQGIRRYGSAAIDLCFVADGRADLFWEMNLNPWDTAAGVIIIESAGGQVSDFAGGPDYDAKRELIASNGYLHPSFMAIVNQVLGNKA